jgi:hypothetical protein
MINFIPIGINIVVRLCTYIYLKYTKRLGKFEISESKSTLMIYGENNVHFSFGTMLSGFLFPLKHNFLWLKISWSIVCLLIVCIVLASLEKYKVKYAYLGLQLMERRTLKFQFDVCREQFKEFTENDKD